MATMQPPTITSTVPDRNNPLVITDISLLDTAIHIPTPTAATPKP